MQLLPPFQADRPLGFENMPISVDLNVFYVSKVTDGWKSSDVEIGALEKRVDLHDSDSSVQVQEISQDTNDSCNSSNTDGIVGSTTISTGKAF